MTRLIRNRPCAWCECYPCRCRLASSSQPCACGGIITAQGDPRVSLILHHATPQHVAWRQKKEGP